MYGEIDVVKYLVSKGASNENSKDEDGKIPYYFTFNSSDDKSQINIIKNLCI